MFKLLVTLIIFCSSNLLFAQGAQRVWIYFSDKGRLETSDIAESAKSYLSDRAIKRRMVKAVGQSFEYTDLPIEPAYRQRLEQLGVTIHHESRWLNAVSAYLNQVEVSVITQLPYVNKIEAVKKYRYEKYGESYKYPIAKSKNGNYGLSENQNAMLGVISAHENGYRGEGVRIAMFDTGFILQHEALQHIKVIDTYDFVQNDEVVANQEGDLSIQHNHGTLVLSVIAAYKPGELIGTAYEAEFLLAKTEDERSETSLEEDNWVAAAEWADSMGADIISTSVGYGGEVGYTYENMDGNSTIITKAADLAVKKGIVVFASAGNEGLSSWVHILAPADGDSVIAVGAVNPDRSLYPKSSRGPTFDGRIKPDLMAQGGLVYTVNPNSTDAYTYNYGTSVACPLGSGAAALVLTIVPDLDPMNLRELLTKTASQSDAPDNQFGYGIIDLRKLMYHITHDPSFIVLSFSGDAFDGRNTINWHVRNVREVKNWIISKRTADQEYEEVESYANKSAVSQYLFSDYDINPDQTYHYLLTARLNSGERVPLDSVILSSRPLKKSGVFQNYPNPFNSNTTITVSLLNNEEISLKLFDMNGRLVKTYVNREIKASGFYHYSWDGRNNNNRQVASGVYYAVLNFKDDIKSIKVLYLK
jgi:hypothetical protein